MSARSLWAAAWLGLSALPAAAQSCSLALVLALDVSSSVDDAEYALQRDGLAQALREPDIVDALMSQGAPVALAVYEWSGRRQSSTVLDWSLLDSPQDVAAAATAISAAQRSFRRFPTALGFALGYGATLLDRGPVCLRKVIDVSGDGITNDGFWPGLAYKHFPFEDVTVNGLVVLGADPDVLDHYTFEVQRGPGSFVETAEGYEDFHKAMARKLFREINGLVVGAASSADPEPG